MGDKRNDEETHERAFWVIGIGIIVFLVLLFGSIIGLKYTRDNLGKVENIAGKTGTNVNLNEEELNYKIWEDGTKENISEELKTAQVTVDNVKFLNFAIIERESEALFEGEEKHIDADITFAVENTGEEKIESSSYNIKLLDSDNKVLTKFSLSIQELPAKEFQTFMHNENTSCVNATKVEIEKY